MQEPAFITQEMRRDLVGVDIQVKHRGKVYTCRAGGWANDFAGVYCPELGIDLGEWNWASVWRAVHCGATLQS